MPDYFMWFFFVKLFLVKVSCLQKLLFVHLDYEIKNQWISKPNCSDIFSVKAASNNTCFINIIFCECEKAFC